VFWTEVPELKEKLLLAVSGEDPDGYVLHTSFPNGSVTDITRQNGSAVPLEQFL
jgi:hypothetical protein